jgi:small-conductance mechanosensitive channel
MSPDPTYRQQTDLHLSYGTNFDQVWTLLEKTTREVDGVLPDKPVEVLHWQFGRFGRTVRVRWWIASCEADNRTSTAVNAALEATLAAADIQIGYTAVDLQIDGQFDESAVSAS